MTTPRVSVVVPTRDRAASLQRLLVSLSDQRFTDLEVVVVDDGSLDDTAAVVGAFGPALPTVLVRTAGVGAVAARCVGVERSSGDVLAFTDDDCLPDAGWLEHGVAAIEAGADVAQGRTVPARPAGPLERSVEHAADDGLFPTCNVFYRRSAYDAAGGFDTDAAPRLGLGGGRGFGEDTLLGWAVARRGHAVAVADAVVRHDVSGVPIREHLSRAWAARGFPALVREVPELRGRVVHRGIVLGRPGPRLGAYGAVAVAAGPLRPVGLVALAWWVLRRAKGTVRRSEPLAPQVPVLLARLVIDVTTCAALVVGSVRARVPLL